MTPAEARRFAARADDAVALFDQEVSARALAAIHDPPIPAIPLMPSPPELTIARPAFTSASERIFTSRRGPRAIRISPSVSPTSHANGILRARSTNFGVEIGNYIDDTTLARPRRRNVNRETSDAPLNQYSDMPNDEDEDVDMDEDDDDDSEDEDDHEGPQYTEAGNNDDNDSEDNTIDPAAGWRLQDQEVVLERIGAGLRPGTFEEELVRDEGLRAIETRMDSRRREREATGRVTRLARNVGVGGGGVSLGGARSISPIMRQPQVPKMEWPDARKMTKEELAAYNKKAIAEDREAEAKWREEKDRKDKEEEGKQKAV
ncbi:uncharacterized protein LAJ45_03667 [Morchella importuna]|uniref:uncharacterized protein n=1 Tax=Morchella importuna TaxID=1174673 RepID=UPI001E8CAA56|nr:uncharacterized protein LAJ45_03667 [Morchella importuna]KAH8152241.1 hypothetical protein LAJ45_03667 [Morchella importuna]